MGCNFGVICRPNGFLKIVEIVLGLICMILLRAYNIDWGQGDALTGLDRRLMGITTIGGMLLVTIPLLISYMINDTGLEKSTLEFIQNTVGAILYLATGAMAIDTYRELPKSELRNVGLALGALSLVNSAAYAVDAFFAFKNKRGV